MFAFEIEICLTYGNYIGWNENSWTNKELLINVVCIRIIWISEYEEWEQWIIMKVSYSKKSGRTMVRAFVVAS